MKKAKKPPHPVDVHVGRQMRLRRLSMGLSQTAVANRIGVTFQQLQKNERGDNRIGAGRLFNLAEILDVPISYFFDGLGRAKGPGFSTAAPSGELLATAAMLERIPDAALKRSIRALIKVLAEGAEKEGE